MNIQEQYLYSIRDNSSYYRIKQGAAGYQDVKDYSYPAKWLGKVEDSNGDIIIYNRLTHKIATKSIGKYGDYVLKVVKQDKTPH